MRPHGKMPRDEEVGRGDVEGAAAVARRREAAGGTLGIPTAASTAAFR